jgi:hypothetical protein
MTPLRFGGPDNPLFGVFHPAHPARNSGHAVLLCNPFGQEAVRIHRLYRLLAEDLAQAGTAALRFDYFGTGDSLGEDEDGQMDRWVNDLRLAHAELLRRSRARQLSWVCARLAGVIAARASVDLTPPPHRIGLWAPVVSGEAYLNELRAAHARALQPLLQVGAPPPNEVPANPATDTELLGFGLHPDLPAQLARVGAADYRALRASEAVVLTHEPDTMPEDLAQALNGAGIAAVHQSVPVHFDWTSEEAVNTALVPQQALQALSQWIRGIDA